MPKTLTIKYACDITAARAVSTGDFTGFDRWIGKLTNDWLAAEHDYRCARDSASNAHHAARYRRRARKAANDLKAMEAAQAAAWTARNKVLLASAEAAAKVA